MNFEDFIKSDLRNSYIEEDGMSIYVRKSKRIVNKEVLSFIDIANVVVDEEVRCKGFFTRFMNRLVDEYSFNIYVESILSPHVERTCKKLGFVRTDPFNLNMHKLRE